jgi:hypothetical protein
MLPRYSSSWIRTRLPTPGPRRIPQSFTSRSPTNSKASLPWNSTSQLSFDRLLCHQIPNRFNPSLVYPRLVFRRLPEVMTSPSQVRHHSGPNGQHDNSYLVSNNKNDAGVRITRIGLYVNLGMAIGKAIGGYVFHSQCKHCESYLWACMIF